MSHLRSTTVFATLALGLWALSSAPAAAAPREGLSPSALYAPDEILWVRISPDGLWLAATATDGRQQRLYVERTEGGDRKRIHTSRDYVHPVYWVDADTFLVRFGKQTVLTNVRAGEGGEIEYEEHVVRAIGTLVHALPTQEDALLWGLQLFGVSSLHRVTVDDLLHFGERAELREGRFGTRVAELDCETASWIINPNGTPFAAHCRTARDWVAYHSAAPGESLREIHRTRRENEKGLLKPMGPAQKPGNLMVTAYRDRDTIGLYEYDPKEKRFVREVFHDDDADVEWLRFDLLTGEVLSVEWNDGSTRRFTYVESSQRRFENLVGEGDPTLDQLIVEASSIDRKRFVYWTESPTEPGAHYLRDVERDETRLVGQKMSALDRKRLAPIESFYVDSSDGFEIEALLTLPLDVPRGGAPLVVMPHGGPLGVHDRQVFDPLIQYLASWGFAVLQANYRGSSGYGQEFQAAGRKNWARGIEDDLDAAFDQTVVRPEIDGDRVCILGGSYGGFSALASALRHPDRFRCVVTLNGVSDVPFLMWDGSDLASAVRAKEAFEAAIGDLSDDRDHLLGISPAYHVESLEAPVLVIYGRRDWRVPPDHAHRLIAMLELYGKEFEEGVVAKGGHSFTPSEWVKTLPILRRFIEKHLGAATGR